MEPIYRISRLEEAELRLLVSDLYREGGSDNVLNCVDAMLDVVDIMIEKLDELVAEEGK